MFPARGGLTRLAFSKDLYDYSVGRDKGGCKMTSGEATAVMQGSQDGGLAVGVAANSEKLTVLRAPKS